VRNRLPPPIGQPAPARPPDPRLKRWLRYKREFWLEEFVAYKRVAMTILLGVLFFLAILLFRFPRTTMRLFQLFSR
jgi:hypothetical protein